jgi:hypothetical protein
VSEVVAECTAITRSWVTTQGRLVRMMDASMASIDADTPPHRGTPAS